MVASRIQSVIPCEVPNCLVGCELFGNLCRRYSNTAGALDTQCCFQCFALNLVRKIPRHTQYKCIPRYWPLELEQEECLL